MPKLYKVWSRDRSERKAVIVGNFEELVKKGKDKLSYDRGVAVTVVLECDGTEVESQEYFSTLPAGTRFILLKNGETWTSDTTIASAHHYDETDSRLPGPSAVGEYESVLRMLKGDISKIVTLNTQELEFLIGLEVSQLENSLNVTSSEAVRIHDKCQRYLDEVQESRDTLELLKMIHSSQNSQQSSVESVDDTDSHTSGSVSTNHSKNKKRKTLF